MSQADTNLKSRHRRKMLYAHTLGDQSDLKIIVMKPNQACVKSAVHLESSLFNFIHCCEIQLHSQYQIKKWGEETFLFISFLLASFKSRNASCHEQSVTKSLTGCHE